MMLRYSVMALDGSLESREKVAAYLNQEFGREVANPEDLGYEIQDRSSRVKEHWFFIDIEQ